MSPSDSGAPHKITSLADLKAIKDKTQVENALREDGYQVIATVHMGTCGIASGSRDVLAALVEETANSGRLDIRVSTSGCIGLCEREPVMTVETLDQPKVIYGDLTADKARSDLPRAHPRRAGPSRSTWSATAPTRIRKRRGTHMSDTTSTMGPRMHLMMCFGTACLVLGRRSRQGRADGRTLQERPGQRGQRHRDRLQRLLRRRPADRRLPGRRLLQQSQPRRHQGDRGRARPQGPPRRAAGVPAPGHPGPHPACSRTSRSSPGRTCGSCATRAASRPRASTNTSPGTATPALAKVLTEMTPADIVGEVKKSGLRGRGGAGFPTGLKWEFASKTEADMKYILCNADEGDPGAFMDRSILEGDPHAVIEGMAIGARAIGAEEGFIYCGRSTRWPWNASTWPSRPATSTACWARTSWAPASTSTSRSAGFRRLRLRRRDGAHELHRGQARRTAAAAAVPGRQKGLWEKPSRAQQRGDPGQHRQHHPPRRRLVPHRRHREEQGHQDLRPGRQDQQRRPGGSRHGHPAGRHHLRDRRRHPGRQGVQGGAAGRPVRRLHPAPAPQRAGGLRVGASNWAPSWAPAASSSWTRTAAWSTWPASSWSSPRTRAAASARPAGSAPSGCSRSSRASATARAKKATSRSSSNLGSTIKDTALCGLGQTAPNPVLSTIRYFRHEYEAHIRDHHCEAGVCSSMFTARCSNACPASVNVPGFVSLIGEKRFDEALRLHRERNPLASICGRVCFHPCESKCARGGLDEPVAIRSLKRFMTEQENEIQLPTVLVNARERQEEDRRGRRRTGRPLLRLLPGPAGLQAHHLREGTEPGRHARAGHPGLPSAAGRARPRDQHDRGAWA